MKTLAPALAALGAVLAVSPAVAQDLRNVDVNLFISPAGEPFTAPKTEAYPIVNWFKGADANGDGRLDADEMRKDAVRFFEVLDRNRDGFVDSQEVTFYEYRLVPEILSPQGALEGQVLKAALQRGVDPIVPNGGGVGQENVYRPRLNTNQGAVFFSLFREPEPVRSADRNFDYRITRQEFEAHSDRHFKALDVNNRGYITLDDLPQTAAEKAARAHR